MFDSQLKIPVGLPTEIWTHRFHIANWRWHTKHRRKERTHTSKKTTFYDFLIRDKESTTTDQNIELCQRIELMKTRLSFAQFAKVLSIKHENFNFKHDIVPPNPDGLPTVIWTHRFHVTNWRGHNKTPIHLELLNGFVKRFQFTSDDSFANESSQPLRNDCIRESLSRTTLLSLKLWVKRLAKRSYHLYEEKKKELTHTNLSRDKFETKHDTSKNTIVL
jgi:hypothetical protein